MRILFLAGLVFLTACGSNSTRNANWAGYLGGDHREHYSTLDQIHSGNVESLTVAWTYQSGDLDSSRNTQIQCNPLVLDGILYGSTPMLDFFALDATSGKELWKISPLEDLDALNGLGVNRGLAYWDGDGERRLLVTAGPFLIAIDAATGTLIPDFGKRGLVDMREGMGRDPQTFFLTANSPGVVFDNLYIVGSRVDEGYGAGPGHIRAYDVRSGAQKWIFHTIPQPGEEGYDTWPADAYTYEGGANSWAGMSLDAQRGLVFIPTGSATADFYGGNRLGSNLFANSLLALDARNGKKIWHFQTVHHDIWDRDLPAAPNLVTVTHDGKPVDAVAQITKTGFVFLFNRETGEPLFPIKEAAMPPSDIPGEEAWPTQPLPMAPPPFVRQNFTPEEATNISDTAYENALQMLASLRTGGPFVPPSLQGTVIFPGFDGGGEWGGAGWDPQSQTLYVNANEMPWILKLFEGETKATGLLRDHGFNTYKNYCAGCHGLDRQGSSFMGGIPALTDLPARRTPVEAASILKSGQGQMPNFRWLGDQEVDALVAFLYDLDTPDNRVPEPESPTREVRRYHHTGYNKFVGADGYPAVRPPWGTLSAIDLHAGTIRWQVPLGIHQELIDRGLPPTGTENYGGPVVTAGDLLFIAATADEKIRAFDKHTGREVWSHDLPAAGYATPATYAVDGKQYLVIACGGGKLGTKSGDSWVAFALPDQH
ncbi:MAG: PQQ-binding-like beta-propeller repeat protein [Saprospiraceae bacterium]|nr:PQQ-binding-like beta-propeller repeat protein [Saprospiraceae bacterium]